LFSSFLANRGGRPEDRQNFIFLIQDLKSAFEGHDLILTAAIGASKPIVDTAYDVPAMYSILDFVHVMCYDYHGSWEEKTGHNAPLYARLIHFLFPR
jgi:chitinase